MAVDREFYVYRFGRPRPGWTDGRTGGRADGGRTDGRVDGRADGRTGGRDGRTEGADRWKGRTDGRAAQTDGGRMGGRTDERAEGRTDGGHDIHRSSMKKHNSATVFIDLIQKRQCNGFERCSSILNKIYDNTTIFIDV